MSLVVNHNLMAANTARNLNSHYSRLATSTQRLSSGLRVNSAADDAAGLAIRELMRVDMAALNQGARNANDAISMIQVADGALSIIDEKLIRMKELAEQASTGTYDSTQRLMIDSEFQAMGSEIDRIARATDFNGIKLLDGSRAGKHDGSGLEAKGAMKIHFGAGNDSAEDYYYVNIPACTLEGLGLASTKTAAGTVKPEVFSLATLPGAEGGKYSNDDVRSGLISMSYIPAGSKNVSIIIDGFTGAEDDIQIFTRDGIHLAGTPIGDPGGFTDPTWTLNHIENTSSDLSDLIKPENGFYEDAKYQLPSPDSFKTGEFNDGANPGRDLTNWNLNEGREIVFSRDGAAAMKIYYSGDYDHYEDIPDFPTSSPAIPNDGSIYSGGMFGTREKLTIDNVTEDILIIVSGTGIFGIDAKWDEMPATVMVDGESVLLDDLNAPVTNVIDIRTQEKAQRALEKIDSAIVSKDKIRAHLGALQNRLENTITSLNIQAENLQASESRISDADVATEMTEFVRNQILTQSATAMLTQANSLPQMAMQIIGG